MLFQKPYLAQAVVTVNDSPEKAAHLYHPHLYKETLSANGPLLNTYSSDPGRAGNATIGLEHRTVTHALLANPAHPGLMQESSTLNTGGYDLAELRKKLEARMEYSKVQTLPHDPAMDPDQTIPSYATSTGHMEDQRQMTGVGSSRNDLTSSDEDN